MSLYDCHGGPGTTEPACGACVTCLLRVIEQKDQRIKRLEEALGSIQEYWNRDNNEKAMEDACWHAINTAAEALEAKEANP